MPRFLTRFSAAALAFVFAFSSLQFSAENQFEEWRLATTEATTRGVELEPPASTTDNQLTTERDNNTFSTLGKAQAALTAQEMRGYQSLYEMQAELFAECVAKLKRWDGSGVKTLAGICAEEKKEMNEQGVNRLLIPDATGEQLNQEELKGQWWKMVIDYWFGKEVGLLPELKQTYTETLRSVTAPVADPENTDLKKSLRKLVWTRE